MAQAVSAVETSRKERLLLVRVPAFVAEHWLKVAPECDAPLGVVQPQGAMAAGRFQDWARNSTSQVTCFDSGRDCESSVKADPGMCDYWRYSECCGECVAQGLALRGPRPALTPWSFARFSVHTHGGCVHGAAP